MIVFLAADGKRYEELDNAVRHYLAWKDLAGSEERIRDLDLPPQQAAQARQAPPKTDETVALRISASYQWLLIPALPATASNCGSRSPRPTRPRTASPSGPRTGSGTPTSCAPCKVQENIRLNLNEYSLWARDGHVAAGKLSGMLLAKSAHMPRLTERSVLERGILAVFDSLTWEAHGFALATGYDEKTSRYAGLAIPHEDPLPPSSPKPPCSSSRPGPAPSETPSALRRPRQHRAPARRSSRPGGRQCPRYRRR